MAISKRTLSVDNWKEEKHKTVQTKISIKTIVDLSCSEIMKADKRIKEYFSKLVFDKMRI